MALTQTGYRFGADDGAENTHTFLADLNTAITKAPTDTSVFLLRILVQADATGLSNVDLQLQYSLNGGTFTNVTTTSAVVKAIAAASITNAGTSTSRLGGTGTFIGATATSEDGNCGGNSLDIASNGRTEAVFGITLSTGIANGDTITLRVLGEAAVLTGGYTVTPTINIVVPAPSITSIDTDDVASDAATGVAIAGSDFGATETGSAKVEISNNATYGSGTVVEVDATSWSATSITVTMRRESDAAALNTLLSLPLSPAYLWVTDSAGTRNATGKQFALNPRSNVAIDAVEWVVEYTAPAPVTGTVAQTLAVVNQAASAAVNFAGTVAQQTMVAAQAITANEIFEGTGAQSGEPAIQELTGLLEFLALAAQAAAAAQQESAGSVIQPISGAAAQDLAAAIQAAAGLERFHGTAAQDGRLAEQAIAASLRFLSSVAQDGRPIEQSAAGALRFSGALVQDGMRAIQTSAALLEFIAAAEQIIAAAQQTSAGSITSSAVTGTASQSVLEAQQAASGTQGTAIAGGVVQAALVAQQAITGLLRFAGASANVATPTEQAAAGSALLAITGALDQTQAAGEQDGVGVLVFLGQVAQDQVAALQSVTGGQGMIVGSAAQVAAASAQAGNGVLSFHASVVQQARRAEQSGTMRQIFSGVAIQLSGLATQQVLAVLPAVLVLDEIDATVLIDSGRYVPVRNLHVSMATVN